MGIAALVLTSFSLLLIAANRLVTGAIPRGLRWFGTVVGAGLMITAVFPVGYFLFVDPTFGPSPFSYEPPAGTERANEILQNILLVGGFLGVAPLPIWTALVGRTLLRMGTRVTVGVTTEG